METNRTKNYWLPQPTSDELYHHGILGQRWGKKNGPPYPLTSDKYSEAESRYISISNTAKMMREEAEWKSIKIGADLSSAVDKCKNCKLHGFENRLKTEKSIARKIDKKSIEDNTNIWESANKIKDTVRYTALSDDDDFVSNYETIKKELKSKGYEETRCKNYFDEYRKGKVKHKSVQSNFKDTNSGFEFEIQFQTPSSQQAKDKKVPLYEARRRVGISEKRAAELERQMVELAEQVPDPKDIFKIKSH